MKFFENRKKRGAISIFLVMILIPTMLLSAVLIDGSRLASARAMTQEAADLAALSVLASYDQDLKDDFGLFAMDDSSKAEAIYKESLNATLMAYGMSGTEEYSDRIWEILKSAVGAGNPYKEKEFLNLYDFSVDSCSLTPKYSLAEWQVLENQMVEYSKFRGIYVMADRFDILSAIDSEKEKAKKNQEAAGVMEEKMEVDEDNQPADRAFMSLMDSIKLLNSAVDQTASDQTAYLNSLKAKMKKIRMKYTDSDEPAEKDLNALAAEYENSRLRLLSVLKNIQGCASEVMTKADKAKRELNAAAGRLKNFKDSHSGSANEVVGGLAKDAAMNMDQYNEYLTKTEAVLNDGVLKRLSNDRSLADTMKLVMSDIDDAITRYGKELDEAEQNETEEEEQKKEEEEEEEEEPDSYFYYYLTGGDRTEEISAVLEGSSKTRCYGSAVKDVTQYFIEKRWERSRPEKDDNDKKDKANIEKIYGDHKPDSGGDQSAGESTAERGEIDSAVYNARPSKTFKSEENNVSGSGYYNGSGDLTKAKSIVGQGKKDSLIQQAAEAARDDVLCLSYMFGTFKTRMTGVAKFSAEGIPESEKNKEYMPKWRYAHEGGELDMRFMPKKDRETVLRGEIEYLIYGNRTDQANEDTVYATIFAERLANNLIAVYLDEGIKGMCHGAAAAASALSVGIVPEPVFFWIFLTAMATAETVMDMDYLVNYGYKIPLLKTKDNLLLKGNTEKTGVEKYGSVKSGVFVSYEDYLLILLLVKGQHTRLMRSADLIEMNMKKKDGDFSMAKAYTGIQAETGLSTRYLFGSVSPFQEEYEKGGAVGRMKFTNKIYMGY